MSTDQSYSAVIPTPFAMLGIATTDEQLYEIVFLPTGHPPIAPSCRLGEEAAKQILRYLSDPDSPFDLPLMPRGTPFRQRVWNAISTIPRGETRRYGELARLLGSAPRAVGQACGDNPFPLVIPCHRVVSSQGPGGFAHQTEGYCLDAKHWLLNHERSPGARQQGLIF